MEFWNPWWDPTKWIVLNSNHLYYSKIGWCQSNIVNWVWNLDTHTNYYNGPPIFLWYLYSWFNILVLKNHYMQFSPGSHWRWHNYTALFFRSSTTKFRIFIGTSDHAFNVNKESALVLCISIHQHALIGLPAILLGPSRHDDPDSGSRIQLYLIGSINGSNSDRNIESTQIQ